MSENALINAKREEIAQIEDQISDLTSKRNLAQAMLEGMLMMVSDKETDAPQEERRMRLGSKKRVVYKLVVNGFETLKDLNLTVKDHDIDARYIRDVVRKAIQCGDILGDIDDKFILSEAGKEILAKAPKPKDWTQSYQSLSERTPPHRGPMMPGPPRQEANRWHSQGPGRLRESRVTVLGAPPKEDWS